MIRTLKTYLGYATLLCFIVSGLILNVAQLIIFAILRPISKDLYREINHYLQYSYWSQSVAIADWLSNLKFKVYYKDSKVMEEFGSFSGIVISNHRYDIDWLAAWWLSEKLGTLGSDKAMLKASLKHVPVIGWGWALCDMIFLSRNWQKDRNNLAQTMDILLTYPRSFILAFFEGTRFTPAKYEAGIKFAEEKNLSFRPRHHLIPRTRGFNCMVQRIKEGLKNNPKLRYGLYNMQVALDNDDNSRASLSAVLGGSKSTCHIYLERHSYDEVSVDSEQSCSEFLFDIYREKDRLMDHFKKTGKFPGIEKTFKPRLQSLFNWAAWMITVYAFLLYQYYVCFTTGSLLYIISFSTLALSAIFSVKLVINSTKVSKSSSYGTTATLNKNGGNQS